MEGLMKVRSLVAVLALAACSPSAAPPKDAANATNAGHCVNALYLAAEAGDADPERSALMFPWRITSATSPEGRLRLRCEVRNRDTRAWVTADVLCDDSEREECVRVVGYETSEELSIPSQR
jgi:hypothetical protein